MVGIDEVGRGCLAGPLLVVAARQLADLPVGLTDSKLLSRQQRELLYEPLTAVCVFGEGWVKVAEIDRRGLAGALRLGVARALRALSAVSNEEIIMDGPVNYLPSKFKTVNCLIDADLKVPLVSAASIYAKVTRDRLMAELAPKHPDYGFDSHVGYSTRRHRQALVKFGPLPKIHRYSFMPIHQLSLSINP